MGPSRPAEVFSSMAEPAVSIETMGYTQLIEDIGQGIVKIPAFQRDFDWDLDRTLRLLDSIAKCYPIGSFLFWDTDEELGSLRNIGNIALPDVPAGRQVSYVLDGQQRITSLYASVVEAEVEGETYKVYADLEADPRREEIFRRDCPNARTCIPLADLVGERAHTITPRLTKARLRRFSEIREAFRTYRFPVVRVRNQPAHAVCEMFERVNRGGMSLNLFDIMVAKTWSKDFNLRERWDQLSAEFEQRGFGFDGKLMLQAVAAHVRGGVSERDIMRVGRDDIAEAWGHTGACLKLTVDFLRQAVNLPSLGLLSYPAVLVVLSHFFDRNGRMNPDAEQSQLLCQYFWRVGFGARYYADAGSRTEADMKLMADLAVKTRLALWEVDPVLPERITEAPHKPSWAFSAAVLAALARAGPVDLRSGMPVTLDNSLSRANGRHYHHIFPKKWLAGEGWEEKQANSVANIMLIPAQTNLGIGAQPPSKYLREFARKSGDNWRRWLKTHLIYSSAEDALMKGDYARFLKERSKTIAERANRLMGL